jgi:hypothetical protein
MKKELLRTENCLFLWLKIKKSGALFHRIFLQECITVFGKK